MKFSTSIAAAAMSLALVHGKNVNDPATQDSNDPQSSLILNKDVIATGFMNDGQDPPVDGQVPSTTSNNNFINFCLTAPNLPITNGAQVKTGSCNPAPMGMIAAQTKMPACRWQEPPNLSVIKSNTAFNAVMAVQNIVTGNFVNPQKAYYAAPQQLDDSGTIIGHSHINIQKLTDGLTGNSIQNPAEFAFFLGLNNPAQDGKLTAAVTGGLPPGDYVMSSINAAMNHQPVLVAVAQHGPLDCASYFTVTDDDSKVTFTSGGGKNNANTDTAGANTDGGNGKGLDQGEQDPTKVADGNQAGNANQGGNNQNQGGNNDQNQAGNANQGGQNQGSNNGQDQGAQNAGGQAPQGAAGQDQAQATSQAQAPQNQAQATSAEAQASQPARGRGRGGRGRNAAIAITTTVNQAVASPAPVQNNNAATPNTTPCSRGRKAKTQAQARGFKKASRHFRKVLA